jgi:hypothetical protein
MASGVDTSLSTKLNRSFGNLAGLAIVNAWNHQLASSTTGTADLWAGKVFMGQTANADYVDTTNSTCLYGEKGFVAFCDVLDLFDDASIAAAIWTTSVVSTATVTEASGSLTLSGTDAGAGTNRDAAAISNGASGLQIDGQNTEIIISYDYSYSTGSGTPECYAKIQVSDGSNHVDLVSEGSTSPSVNGSGVALLRIVYDDTNNRVDVWRTSYSVNGTVQVYPVESVLLDNTSVSSVTANTRYIRFATRAKANTGTSTTTLNIHAIGYRKNGAGSASADFVSVAQTIPSASTGTVRGIWQEPPSSYTGFLSFNGGTNYTSDCRTLLASGTAGTSLKAKITVAKPTTITADTKNIAVLRGWGATYE